MAVQKALDGFKQLHGDIDKNNHLFVGTINPDFVQMAISALEKQIPKKPLHTDEYNPYYGCPECKHIINAIQDYCERCGQAIDWSDGE